MYSTCIFCHTELGANEVIESFPVGRRLAFDAAKGRLWVVCRKCERWNLTPIEERWEAVEQCERLFTSTRLRVSSDNIGLSRLREGLELVRIGSPQRPEMAAWRYGDQFGRRRRRYIMMSAAGGVVVAGAFVAFRYAGFVAGGGYGMWQLVNAARKFVGDRIVRARLALPGEARPTVLRGKDMRRVVLSANGDAWSLRIPRREMGERTWNDRQTVEVFGADALRAAATLMPAVNLKGGKRDEIEGAVRQLEELPDPHQLFLRAAGMSKPGRRDKRRYASIAVGESFLDRLPPSTALALEMAAHEDIERRAMDGELSILERAWREAEEIAAISDSLLLPESVGETFAAISKAE